MSPLLTHSQTENKIYGYSACQKFKVEAESRKVRKIAHIAQNRPNIFVLYPKKYPGVKSTPPPVSALVTNIRYEYTIFFYYPPTFCMIV